MSLRADNKNKAEKIDNLFVSMAGNSVLIMPAQLVTHQNTVDMSERFGLNDTRQEKSSRTKTGCWDLPGKNSIEHWCTYYKYFLQP